MNDTMLAGRTHLDTRKFGVEEVPTPVPGPGEVLVEVKAARVCLSDLHGIDGTLSPMFARFDVVPIDHERSGVIHTLGGGRKRGLDVSTWVTPPGQPAAGVPTARVDASAPRVGRAACDSFRARREEDMNILQRRRAARLRAYAQLKRRHPELFTSAHAPAGLDQLAPSGSSRSDRSPAA